MTNAAVPQGIPSSPTPARFVLSAAEAVLSLAAWIRTIRRNRTPVGLATGKVVVVFRPSSASHAARLTLGILLDEGRFGRARLTNRTDLLEMALAYNRDDRDDYSISLRRNDFDDFEVSRFDVTPGFEKAVADIVALRLRLLSMVLRERGRDSLDSGLYVDPVPQLTLAASRAVTTIPAGSRKFTWSKELTDETSQWPVDETNRPVRVLILDTDIDEKAFKTRPSYLRNYITRGNLNTAANDPSNALDYREPGTHGTLVAGVISVVDPAALLWIGRIAFADSGDARPVDADFLAVALLAASKADPPFDVVNISVVEPRYEFNVQQGASDFKILTWALDELVARGTVVNAATGNVTGAAGATFGDEVGYPARAETVTAVGSMAWDGTRSRFSRFGTDKPDIVAIGGQTNAAGEATETIGTYGDEPAIGTSIACAVASGVLARIAGEISMTNGNEAMSRAETLCASGETLLLRLGSE